MLGNSLHVQIHTTYTLLQFVALVTHLAIDFGTCSDIRLTPHTSHSASADPQDTHMRADTLRCPGRRCLHGDHHRSEDTAYRTESLRDRHRILQEKWSELTRKETTIPSNPKIICTSFFTQLSSGPSNPGACIMYIHQYMSILFYHYLSTV